MQAIHIQIKDEVVISPRLGEWRGGEWGGIPHLSHQDYQTNVLTCQTIS